MISMGDIIDNKKYPGNYLDQIADERDRPECIENIEHYWPNDPNDAHPCFLVDDMQETIYTLRERRTNETLGLPGIGKGKRWILNLRNADNTRVEFTEAHLVK